MKDELSKLFDRVEFILLISVIYLFKVFPNLATAVDEAYLDKVKE